MSSSCTHSTKHSAGIIKIDGHGSTDFVLNRLVSFIQDGFFSPEKFEKATLRYDATKSLGAEDDKAYYPLKFYSEIEDTEIWLSDVTTGDGEKSRVTIKALNIMKFDIGRRSKEDILKKKALNKVYIK